MHLVNLPSLLFQEEVELGRRRPLVNLVQLESTAKVEYKEARDTEPQDGEDRSGPAALCSGRQGCSLATWGYMIMARSSRVRYRDQVLYLGALVPWCHDRRAIRAASVGLPSLCALPAPSSQAVG